ncbi:MAG: hypothetical protein CVV06_10715 [Gammaproteobacteria bacterium HGW-Gammaproteobacteria-10]|nr:MAG: hypothetical protein CVV06_10715 [Gammaproteobacteria bacterium HGW-Gammaproteobacteria-10]
MEAFLFAAALVASFGTLVIFYRANRLLAALPADKAAVVSGKVTSLMVSAGKWLTVAGGIGTLPLVALLVFAPNAPGFQWVFSSGFAGCLAFVLAALLLVPAGLINGIAHSVQVKRLAVGGARFVLDKGLSLVRQKTFWISLSVMTVVITFLPWIIDLLTFGGYAWLLFIAGKLGMLDHDHSSDEAGGMFYNYATGKFDHGYSFGGRYNHTDE